MCLGLVRILGLSLYVAIGLVRYFVSGTTLGIVLGIDIGFSWLCSWSCSLFYS